MYLAVKLGKLTLKTPIICASGTFGFGEELKGLVNFKNIGAITTKTITLKPRRGNLPPRIFETDHGVLNSVGLENPGLDVFVAEKLPELKKFNTKFIVSIGGFSSDEYEEIVRQLAQFEEIEAIEVNLSCPNIQLKKMVSQDKTLTYELLKELRQLTSKVLIAKITPEVTDIVEIVQSAREAGVNALSLVNTFYGMAINIEERKPYLGSIYGGYSGRAIKPLSLYRVWTAAKTVDIPIIGGGGIESATDAIEFLLAGSSLVSLGTINLVYPNQAEQILKGIKDYMKKMKIENIDELRGGLIV
ncbi:MAG: dihydroorotate dehydrogenase [Candidatus Omnitrophota bacterium]|nr:MAG: dihydroorotate dehydrogenase [Candidatus Omnitrophota bacterium]